MNLMVLNKISLNDIKNMSINEFLNLEALIDYRNDSSRISQYYIMQGVKNGI